LVDRVRGAGGGGWESLTPEGVSYRGRRGAWLKPRTYTNCALGL